MGLKQKNQCFAGLLLVLLVSPSCLAFSLRNLISPVEKSSEVEGRQFSDDPIMNYAAWGFIAGLMDYFIRDAIAMSATTTTTTTTAATTAATTTTTTAASASKKRNKHKNRKNKNKNKHNKHQKEKEEVEVTEEVEDMEADVEEVATDME